MAFHSPKEPARTNTRASAGSFISFRQPLWNTSNAFYHKSFPLFLPLESPRRAIYPRRLLIKKFLFQSFIIPNCPVLTVDIFRLKNTVSKNIKPVKFPCILFFKKSPEISTLIFGQFNFISRLGFIVSSLFV